MHTRFEGVKKRCEVGGHLLRALLKNSQALIDLVVSLSGSHVTQPSLRQQRHRIVPVALRQVQRRLPDAVVLLFRAVHSFSVFLVLLQTTYRFSTLFL